jgi:hypothetical protein
MIRLGQDFPEKDRESLATGHPTPELTFISTCAGHSTHGPQNDSDGESVAQGGDGGGEMLNDAMAF